MNAFHSPENSLGSIRSDSAARLIAAASDVALVLDRSGVIKDVAFGDENTATSGIGGWLGQPWIDTVAIDSRQKVEQLLREAITSDVTRAREVNQKTEGGGDIPIRYSAVRIGEDGHVVAVGRELRTLSKLQQKLVEAQRAMERDYSRFRHAETRYRLLFYLSSEAMFICDLAGQKITDVNPAATQLVGMTAGMLVGQSLATLFADRDSDAVQELIVAARVSGRPESLRAVLSGSGLEVIVSPSVFRLDNASQLLVRLNASGSDGLALVPSTAQSRVAEIVRAMPDGFVVTDPDRRILEANRAFLDLAGLTSPEQVRGESLDRWLGRPAVDIGVIMSNLREHGALRDFATVLRGEFGAREEVEVSAVSAIEAETPCLGFVIRRSRDRIEQGAARGAELPRSVEQLTELVGRVSLKEIVRETSDVIERLCIEAALKLTRDNRASAAQLLGLSRQSLYGKLRRFGIGDLGEADETQDEAPIG